MCVIACHLWVYVTLGCVYVSLGCVCVGVCCLCVCYWCVRVFLMFVCVFDVRVFVFDVCVWVFLMCVCVFIVCASPFCGWLYAVKDCGRVLLTIDSYSIGMCVVVGYVFHWSIRLLRQRLPMYTQFDQECLGWYVRSEMVQAEYMRFNKSLFHSSLSFYQRWIPIPFHLDPLLLAWRFWRGVVIGRWLP